ncbi:hypothetical protein ASG17_12450 [Brevundimonas sp. Leaf363]|uniref:hypothetical protein n=1 Tax=Brevundimonas sp. Leaf363 TaxID=1736353 RepID=UPI0006F8A8C2|nr:hypothetical protein [Brevundimonas sp. Leaf363]KQS54432.1 hypothetical protein ASG17_12450 [Brevundimonas sp. Leaf363]
MRRLLCIIALSALAAACATRPAPSPTAAIASPAPTPGRDWRLIEDPQGDTRLAYGGEESDDLALALDCAPGARRLTLSGPAATGVRPEFHLESGGDTERYAAHAEDAGFTDGAWLTAEAASTDPVFLRFRRLGWVALWRGEQREMLAGHAGSLAGVKRFFDVCEGAAS